MCAHHLAALACATAFVIASHPLSSSAHRSAPDGTSSSSLAAGDTQAPAGANTVHTASPAVPTDAATAVLEAFRDHDIVAIGDAHGNQLGQAFQLSLIGDPRFAAVVDDVVIEVGNSRHQDVIDRYVRGEEIPRDALRRVWFDTTQQQAVLLEVPAIVTAVRALNATRPAARPVRVLLGEPPIDWSRLQTADELRAWQAAPESSRDRFAAELIRREVLARQRRALLLYGAGHVFRKPAEQSIVTLLESSRPRVFTIWTNAAAEMSTMQADVAGWPVRSLARIRNTTLGKVGFSAYLGPNAGHVPPEWLVPMEEQFDAVLYLGPLASMILERPPVWPCDEPALPERLRRLRLQRPALADQVASRCTR